jgi:pSer/pThr/pTyr-binding forkhead associated (FHA) protein
VIADSIQVQEALLVLKIVFLVLLYLFIWRIVRAASRDVRTTQESFILAPQQAAALRGQSAPAPAPPVGGGTLVVVKSPALPEGERRDLDSAALTLGRAGANDLVLDADEFASTQHARVEPRPDGVWVQDLGSTNGTYVNGTKLTRPRRLAPGDVLRVGETELRFDA